VAMTVTFLRQPAGVIPASSMGQEKT
jgi:hypothetical protein